MKLRKRLDILKDKLYKFWHGHDRLWHEEADIICKTRSNPNFNYLTDSEIKELINVKIKCMYRVYRATLKCKN